MSRVKVIFIQFCNNVTDCVYFFKEIIKTNKIKENISSKSKYLLKSKSIYVLSQI